MKLNQVQIAELHILAAPVRAFLRQNCHPHCRVIVEDETVEVTETVSRTIDDEEAARAEALAQFHEMASMRKPTRKKV